MCRVARHVFRSRSTVDGTEQPYVVCAPRDLDPGQSAPILFVLHDTLADPTTGGFVEMALRRAADWLEALEATPPLILVQPFGRGNAGWLGIGGRDLFDTHSALRTQFPCDDDAVSLLGIGAGATGALQLACWFPDRFAALALIAPWADDRQELPLGIKDRPDWEKAQRRAVNPLTLAGNLDEIPIHLEHPWWFHGIDGSAGPEHHAALSAAFEGRTTPIRVPDQADPSDALDLGRSCPSDLPGLLRWLAEQRRDGERKTLRFTTYSLRSNRVDRLRIDRLSRFGAPGSIKAKRGGKGFKVKTHGVEALSIRLTADSARAADVVRIDKRDFSLPAVDHDAPEAWVRFERVAKQWRLLDVAEAVDAASDDSPESDGAETTIQPLRKSPTAPGLMMDLRWGAVAFVPGTLGDEPTNERQRALAERWRDRWRTGADSLNPHPADHTSGVDYPVRTDVDVTESELAERNLVLIGSPSTNLLLARFRAALPCEWYDRSVDECSSFSFGGRRYEDPRDALLLVYPNPRHPQRSLLVVTGADPRAFGSVANLSTAYLPDFLVLRGTRVLDWGYFDADWRIADR